MLVFRARAEREAGSGRVLSLSLPALDSRPWMRICPWLTQRLWDCSTIRPVQSGGRWVQEAEDLACQWLPWQWRGCCLRQRSRGIAGGGGDIQGSVRGWELEGRGWHSAVFHLKRANPSLVLEKKVRPDKSV